MSEPWMNNSAIQALMGRILDRLDSLGLEDRSRRFTFRLSDKTFPELYLQASPDDSEYLWSLLERMSSTKIVEIELDKRRTASTIARERSPVLVMTPEAEVRFREILGRKPLIDPWSIAWARGCEAAQWLPVMLRTAFRSREHRLGERAPTEILSRWERLTKERFDGLGLREVAARLFWGISKALDERYEIVNALRDAHGLPWIPERPLLLPTFLAPTWREKGVLFVENLSSYVACLAGRVPASHGLAIVYGSGYKSAARRLRKPEMTLMAFDPRGDRTAEPAYLTWFGAESDDVPTFFWGDLDYAGLSILRELRRTFPGMRAWTPGYERMVNALENGNGHTPSESDKRGQEDLGPVGCPYADDVLLEVLRRTAQFFDQEGA